MNSRYRFELLKKQLEGERNEIEVYETRLRYAFAILIWIHTAIANGKLDEESCGHLPRSLHLFRSYARDLLRCYETDVVPSLRALGYSVPDCLDEPEHVRH